MENQMSHKVIGKLKLILISILCFIFFLSVLVNCDVSEDFSIKYEAPGRCNFSQNETFSWATLGCVRCQWKSVDAPDYCPCPAKTVSVEEPLKCSRCPENAMVFDGSNCIRCGELNPYSLTTEKCLPCPPGHIEVAYNDDGSMKEVLDCIKCSSGLQPSGRKCVECHRSFSSGDNSTCKCPEGSHSQFGGICFANSDLSETNVDTKTAYKIEYGGYKADSMLFRENLVAAFYLCKGKQNQTACQMLGNMCTLNLHSYGEDWTACRLYRTAVGGRVTHPPNYVPRIYYTDVDVEASSVLIRSTTIPHIHNTDYSSSSSDVNITLAKFSFTGEFLGLTDLEDLLPCRESKIALKAGRKFGTNFRAKCQLSLKDIWESFSKRMVFLDPYVSYRDDKETDVKDFKGKRKTNHDMQLQLYPVPVKIQNFKWNGVKVNLLEDKHQWQLVRRFFIIDTIGSVDRPGSSRAEDESDSEAETGSPKVVRYLKSLRVRIQLQNSQDAGKIYIPLITLTYADVTQEEFNRNELVEFEYSVDYFMDMARSIEDVKISIGVLSAIAVLWSAIQAWSWNRRNGQLEIDLTTISNLIIIACGNLADIFFIVCFSTGLFWFVFFKKQVAVHVFLPDMYQERLVRDLMISAFSLKIVAILQLIRQQSNIDIFFVDWERPRVKGSVEHHPQQNVQTSHNVNSDRADKGEESVSIWRTYFIANEWNEIQTTRKVHMAAQIIVSIFLLEVVGFKFWGLHWPIGDLSPEPQLAGHIPYSTSARFVVGTLIFGLIGIVQWIYRVGFYERYVENEIQDFVDLCTMGNISVVILAAKQQGYYIHGRSVHGFADTDMQTMIEQLNREEEDLCGRRGLLPQTDQQTFLISVPGTFRLVYNQVLQPLYASSASATALFAKSRQVSGGKTPIGQGWGLASAVPKPTTNMLNLSIHAYHSMNKFLTAFLEHALSDLDYDIMRKTFFEGAFDMEFNEVGNDRAVFYTDDGHSFDSVLFYGHERTLFLFNLYTFIFVDMVSHNYVLAGVVVFVTDLILKAVRSFFGKRNLARKTLIDIGKVSRVHIRNRF